MPPVPSEPTYTLEPLPTTRPSGRQPFGSAIVSGNDDESRATAGVAMTMVATALRIATRRRARNGFADCIWSPLPLSGRPGLRPPPRCGWRGRADVPFRAAPEAAAALFGDGDG